MNEQEVPERAPTTVAPRVPEALAGPPAASGPDHPQIAAKAHDLEAIKKAVDDAASVGAGLWLSYLFVLIYLAITTGEVTHADLFFERSVKLLPFELLPFLSGIELSLNAFFVLAPILLLIVHGYTLVHLVILTDKAKRFDRALSERGGDVCELRGQLPNNIFVQFLAGPAEVSRGAFGWLLRAIAWATLVSAPVLLLLMMQIQFLPFHSSLVTWFHRLALLADLMLLWWLWSKVVSGREVKYERRWTSWGWLASALVLSGFAILFSWTAATFPGEWQEDHLTNWDGLGGSVSLHDILFDHGRILSGVPGFYNELDLPGLEVSESFYAGFRDLKGANFGSARLTKVNFSQSKLQGALFDSAQLQGTSFYGARLQATLFDQAQLQGADLTVADLRGAWLKDADARGASFINADLRGASLDHAHLEGAMLNNAKLEGASLENAKLEGASLENAHLQGASLQLARLMQLFDEFAHGWAGFG
jgi:uncharacterized protein YjbI with pentapeptide repeats